MRRLHLLALALLFGCSSGGYKGPRSVDAKSACEYSSHLRLNEVKEELLRIAHYIDDRVWLKYHDLVVCYPKTQSNLLDTVKHNLVLRGFDVRYTRDFNQDLCLDITWRCK